MLTDTKIRTLKPRATAYRVADTNGLCIEVRPSGAKAWRYRYRYAGKPSIITMAEYRAIGLAEARAERDRLRALVRGGSRERRQDRAGREDRAGRDDVWRHCRRALGQACEGRAESWVGETRAPAD